MDQGGPVSVSLVEQMARFHYETTDVNAPTVPWSELSAIKRGVLLHAMDNIVGRIVQYSAWFHTLTDEEKSVVTWLPLHPDKRLAEE